MNFILKDLFRSVVLIWRANMRVASINVILQVVLAILPVASLLCLRLLIDAMMMQNMNFSSAMAPLVAWGGIQMLQAVTGQYTAFINTIHQQHLTDYLSLEVLNKAVSVKYDYYENPVYHDTLHLAQQQVIYKTATILNGFNAMLLNSLSLCFLFGFLFSMKPAFALLLIILSLPLAVIKWYAGFSLTHLERKLAPSEREAHYLHYILTSVGHAKEVRIFGFGAALTAKFKHIRAFILQGKKDVYKKNTLYSIVAEILEVVVITIILIYLARSVWGKTITVGVFVIYLQGFQRLQTTSRNFLQALVQLFQQRVFLRDLFLFLDLPVPETPDADILFPRTHNGLSVNNVSFRYPQSQHPVLQNISFSCTPGNIIALVGENGSGKSTMVKLLARLYELQTGSVKIDDVEISGIALTDFRNNSTFLFQDFERYFLTVGENIAFEAFHDPENLCDVQHAATLAGAHTFISKLSAGYHCRMGTLFQGSEQLSGGQWQKLALARLFYRNGHLMVLDEPTSALDATAEYEVFQHVRESVGNKMVLLITHRLYNLKIADYIYFMKDGMIAEEGTFDNLISANGLFRNMYDKQKL
ncbi:ATP-binding cassette, subfamily B [Chitinophaga sp. CF118]|uniref:ABC transporter ATP-binding protein n=1 Tax=Chitinophaga sp. CF118 TaxID=1884367 RepID=UPI0008F3CA2D|nr:ABC transporter ATP-binding protein [Chitinophaga sp. CF118]SFD79765.1 ATP-binding cassette, subfamily B [Chitinophaga sp. CF118]